MSIASAMSNVQTVSALLILFGSSTHGLGNLESNKPCYQYRKVHLPNRSGILAFSVFLGEGKVAKVAKR